MPAPALIAAAPSSVGSGFLFAPSGAEQQGQKQMKSKIKADDLDATLSAALAKLAE
jgi:hypothetical protein